MGSFVLTPERVSKAQQKINTALINEGVSRAMLIDDAGNILTDCGNTEEMFIDTMSLAALTAANYGATAQIAQLIGEEDFSVHYHKGEKLSIHFSKMGRELIMITIFPDTISLGLIRCRVKDLEVHLTKIFEG